jgi:saccharopine dehydrogenase-like NADP-dependent oxidoreductase
MNVLLVGVGGVGEAIAVSSKNRPWLQKMVLADYSRARAEEVQRKLGQPERFTVETVDARNRKQVAEIARRHKAGIVMNAVSNIYNDPVFDAAGEAGCHYLDMAMSGNGAAMGSYQFGQAQAWAEKGILAVLGVGADPGMSDVFAKYAAKHLFDSIDEIGVRDGASLEVEGTDFAPTFSLIDAIEECTDPPLIWERDRGWYETELFSEPEVFDFPEGIGPLECVNVEHEEVVLIPRVIDCKRVTFKYALGDKFIEAFKAIKLLGLESPEPVQVGKVQVAPRDVVVACLPDPAHLGARMHGKTCVGTWLKGMKDGLPRQVYLYQVTDNGQSMARYGCQAVAWQTGVAAAIALELVAEGVWKGAGVVGPEAFDPDPYLERMPGFDFAWGMKEMN